MTDDTTLATPTELGAADILKIMSYLPHRYPFLLVDRVIEIDGDRSGIGIKNVTFNEPHFQGHFPVAPVMPGVLLIEGMAQTAGVICAASRPAAEAPRIVYFMTIDKAKFRKPVTPGDVVEFHLKQLKKRGRHGGSAERQKVAGALVCEAEISAMLVDS